MRNIAAKKPMRFSGPARTKCNHMQPTTHTDLFASGYYLIDQKPQLFRLENCYRIYNGDNELIGQVKHRMSLLYRLLKPFLHGGPPHFSLTLYGLGDEVIATLTRGFMSATVPVKAADGSPLGKIHRQRNLSAYTFTVLDTNNQPVGGLSTNWDLMDFLVLDAAGRPIGNMSKRWSGVARELLTSADQFTLQISPAYTDATHKMMIVLSVVVLDMAHFEHHE